MAAIVLALIGIVICGHRGASPLILPAEFLRGCDFIVLYNELD
jgi:hypothetical protein